MANYYDILKTQLITEKTTKLASSGKYTFEVIYGTNKIEVKKAVEEVFKVHVAKVNMINVRAKEKKVGKYSGLKPRVSKAIVTLNPGETLDIFEV
jgi:large subunit ribosomal protein L23